MGGCGRGSVSDRLCVCVSSVSVSVFVYVPGGCIAPITYDDGTDGPHRVWLRDEEVPGLAMSRSVGDTIGKLAGVSSEAEVTEVVWFLRRQLDSSLRRAFAPV